MTRIQEQEHFQALGRLVGNVMTSEEEETWGEADLEPLHLLLGRGGKQVGGGAQSRGL